MRPWLTSGRLSRGLTAQRLLIQGPAVQLLLKTTSVETVDNVGIQKLKRLVMESIKELRKLRNKSDQAISFGTASTDDAGVRPGPGLKQRDSQVVNQVKLSSQSQASSNKRQAASFKHQASSSERVKHQATSVKPFAASVKLKPASVKLHDA